MSDRLSAYRHKRSAERTPEPVPAEGPLPRGHDDTFVIQEHHARRLHWDFRLERDGVLVSWAVPKGLPTDPRKNRLAVHTEDHPLDYATFAGGIPKGEYGGGSVTIWDRGTYDTEKWEDDEVKVVLHGVRARGRFVLFRTDGDSWMMHRMAPSAGDEDAADEQDATVPMPRLVRPMLAAPGTLPEGDESGWAYEMKWDGVRLVVYVDRGRVRLLTRNDRDVSKTYPELRDIGEALGAALGPEARAVLDGEVVAFDEQGRPSFGALQARMHIAREAQARTLAESAPATFLAFDLLHLDGRDLTRLPYARRRELLESLRLDGAHWQTPPAFAGDGATAVRTSLAQGLEGVVAKRRDSAYEPGRRSGDWVKVKNVRTQEVVVGGWRPGAGRREGAIGSLLLGVHGETGDLVYAGHVGTGFTGRILDDLATRLRPLARKTSPFADEVPRKDAKDAHWVTPRLVGEVAFTEWTRDGRLRHPSWRGLRVDKSAEEVVPES